MKEVCYFKVRVVFQSKMFYIYKACPSLTSLGIEDFNISVKLYSMICYSQHQVAFSKIKVIFQVKGR